MLNSLAHSAGFHAAHGIWSVSDGATLVPILGYTDSGGAAGSERFLLDDAADAARAGAEALQAGRPGWAHAALVADAFLRLPSGRTDALIVDAIEYTGTRRSIKVAIPYRPGSSPEGFAVFRPKFLTTTGFSESDHHGLGDAFFAGVDSHTKAAAVWNAHLVDESV